MKIYQKTKTNISKCRRTCWKVPEMKIRNVLDFWDDGGGEGAGEDLRGQVLKHDLFISGLESESRWELGFSISVNKIEFAHFFYFSRFMDMWSEAVDLHCMNDFIVGMTANFSSMSSLFLFRQRGYQKDCALPSLFCVSFI